MSERSAEPAGRDELDDAMPPPARRKDAGSLAGCLIVAVVILLPALLYFGLFAFILVDELVLETNVVLNNLPDPAIEVLRMIYTPLIWLMDQFDG
jgi:hypothetical protein